MQLTVAELMTYTNGAFNEAAKAECEWFKEQLLAIQTMISTSNIYTGNIETSRAVHNLILAVDARVKDRTESMSKIEQNQLHEDLS